MCTGLNILVLQHLSSLSQYRFIYFIFILFLFYFYFILFNYSSEFISLFLLCLFLWLTGSADAIPHPLIILERILILV